MSLRCFLATCGIAMPSRNMLLWPFKQCTLVCVCSHECVPGCVRACVRVCVCVCVACIIEIP